MGDVALELEWIQNQPESSERVASAISGGNRERLVWLVGIVLAGAAAFLAARTFDTADEPRPMQFRTANDRVWLRNGNLVKFTPDGGALLYVGVGGGAARLVVRELDEATGTHLSGPKDPAQVFVSPDGAWAGFVTGRAIHKVPLSGGLPVELCEMGNDFVRGLSWGADKTIVFGTARGGLFSCPDTGGKPEAITEPPDGEEHNRPWHLPGDAGLLLTVWSVGEGHVAVLPKGSEEPRTLLEGTTPQLAPSGHLIFQRDGSLWAVRFDPATLEVRGTPISFVDEVQVTGNGAAQYSIARNGSLVYVPAETGTGSGDGSSYVVWVDRDRTYYNVVNTVEPASYLSLSPDGTRAVADLFVPGAGGDIWVLDLERNTRTRLMTRNGLSPVWSPDGRKVAFVEGLSGTVWVTSADGSGETELLFEGEPGIRPRSWSPDGRRLALELGADIWMFHVGGELEPFLSSPVEENAPQFSPDGRLLAYASSESGTGEIVMLGLDGAGRRWTESGDQGGCAFPTWSHDGSELYYRQNQRVMAVSIQTEPNFYSGAPGVVLEEQDDFESFGGAGSFSVGPDGERFLMNSPVGSTGTRSLVVLLNWTEELNRLVPIDN